jgi:hypothetical protein
MSEYQYYEFRAIDRPLTPEQMSGLRALSLRGEITSNGFSNTFPAEPENLLVLSGRNRSAYWGMSKRAGVVPAQGRRP